MRTPGALLKSGCFVAGLAALGGGLGAAEAPEIGRLLGPIPGEAREESPQNPYEGDGAALREGRAHFVSYNCYGCHGGRGGGGMAPSLRDQNWIYGGSAADIYHSIAAGRPHAMPAWAALLTREQIWKITAYIQSLRTSAEPERPEERPEEEQESGQG